MQTEMGRIASLLKETPSEKTPLQAQLDRTGKLLGLIPFGAGDRLRARILVGPDAYVFDALARIAPTRYYSVLAVLRSRLEQR